MVLDWRVLYSIYLLCIHEENFFTISSCSFKCVHRSTSKSKVSSGQDCESLSLSVVTHMLIAYAGLLEEENEKSLGFLLNFMRKLKPL